MLRFSGCRSLTRSTTGQQFNRLDTSFHPVLGPSGVSLVGKRSARSFGFLLREKPSRREMFVMKRLFQKYSRNVGVRY